MTKKDRESFNTCFPKEEDDVGSQETNKNKLPIDRGWAWVIVMATFFINLLHVGMYRCYGILFVEFLKEFNASASVTSLVVGLYSVAYSLTALFVLNILIEKFSLRMICVMGGIMLSLGGILSYFAMNLEFLIITQSILPGTGSALLYGPGLVIVGQYFEKRRALGQAISSCGVSLGGMLVPQLIRYLLNEYGLRGTLLISGGILSECLIFALLYRPAPQRKSKLLESDRNKNEALENFRKQIISQDEFEIVSVESLSDSISQLGSPDHDHGVSSGHLDGELANGHLDGQLTNGHPRSNMSVAKMILQRHEPFRARTESDPTSHLRKPENFQSLSVPKESFLSNNSINETKKLNSDTNIADEKHTSQTLAKNSSPRSRFSPNEKRSHTSHKYLGSFMDTLSQSSYLKYASNTDVHMISTYSLNKPCDYLEEEEKYPEKELSCCKKITHLFDFSVFKLPHFYLILGQSMFGVCAISLYAAFLPALAKEVGLTDLQAALLITIYAGADCVSRFLSGVIVETGKIKSHHLLATCLCALGGLYQLTRLYTSMNLLIMYAVLFGTFSGVGPAMGPVVMIDFLGMDNFPKALGFVQVFHGVSLAGITPLIGALKDITGTYHASFHLLGSMAVLAGVCLFIEPLARKLRDAKKVKADAEEAKALNGV